MHRPRRNAAQFFGIDDFGHDAPWYGALWQVAVRRFHALLLRLIEKSSTWVSVVICWVSTFLSGQGDHFIDGFCLMQLERAPPALERSALLGCPIVTLINTGNAAATAADVVQTASVTSRRTPRFRRPVATVRRKSCTFHGSKRRRRHARSSPARAFSVAPSSARLDFDQPANGVPATPGSTSPPAPPRCSQLSLSPENL